MLVTRLFVGKHFSSVFIRSDFLLSSTTFSVFSKFSQFSSSHEDETQHEGSRNSPRVCKKFTTKVREIHLATRALQSRTKLLASLPNCITRKTFEHSASNHFLCERFSRNATYFRRTLDDLRFLLCKLITAQWMHRQKCTRSWRELKFKSIRYFWTNEVSFAGYFRRLSMHKCCTKELFVFNVQVWWTWIANALLWMKRNDDNRWVASFTKTAKRNYITSFASQLV